MTALLFVIAALGGGVVGTTCGFVIGTRQMARMIARMTPAEVDTLADQVRELRDGAS